MITLDFETEAIVGNPIVKPPRPVGLSFKYDDGPSTYVTNPHQIYSILKSAYESGEPLLFHNAPFDLRVAEAHFGLSLPDWWRIHDTVLLLYLEDPYAESLSLKPSAERYLGEPPEEQNALRDWIVTHIPGATASNYGGFISCAPEALVGPYAKGDTDRTYALFRHLSHHVSTAPYDRERQLMPILVRSSQRGIRVDRPALEQAYETYSQALEQADDYIRGALGVPGLNPGSGHQLGQELAAQGLLRQVHYTPTGKVSTKREVLLSEITDPVLGQYIQYRAALETCVGTFIEPWLELSEDDGRIHTEWNQTRSSDRGKRGTRTGRLSSSRPNFQNIPTEFNFAPPESLPPMPNLRQYLLPEVGHRWLNRDFDAQEIRIAAHFEEGLLMQAFTEDPSLDPHQLAKELIHAKTGKQFDRKHVKITGFQIIYGGGGPAISTNVGCTLQEAYALKDAYLDSMPGIRSLQIGTKRRGYDNLPIRTWGGREYYTEPPKMIKGKRRTFEYKLLNYLIQGSAADQTKQCIIDWDQQRGPEDVFMATVHDEINISAPEETWEKSMAVLQDAMDQDLFDVPMRSGGKVGPNWGTLHACA